MSLKSDLFQITVEYLVEIVKKICNKNIKNLIVNNFTLFCS